MSSDYCAEASLDTLELTADGLRMTAYAAEPGIPSGDALNLLASWAATTDQPQPSRLAEKATPRRRPGVPAVPGRLVPRRSVRELRWIRRSRR